jgi:hypothetical protein
MDGPHLGNSLRSTYTGDLAVGQPEPGTPSNDSKGVKKSENAKTHRRRALIGKGRCSRFGERCRFLHSFSVSAGVAQIFNLLFRRLAVG